MLKSMAAREIFRRGPAVKRDLWGGEFWSDGYYVATVGERGNWEGSVANNVFEGNEGFYLRVPQTRIVNFTGVFQLGPT